MNLIDLKHDNLLFRPTDLANIIPHHLVADPSRTYSVEGVIGNGWAPVTVHTATQPIPSWSREAEPKRLEDIELVISDFGCGEQRIKQCSCECSKEALYSCLDRQKYRESHPAQRVEGPGGSARVSVGWLRGYMELGLPGQCSSQYSAQVSLIR